MCVLLVAFNLLLPSSLQWLCQGAVRAIKMSQVVDPYKESCDLASPSLMHGLKKVERS